MLSTGVLKPVTSPKPKADAEGANDPAAPVGALSNAVQSPSSALTSMRSSLAPQLASSTARDFAPTAPFLPPSCIPRGRDVVACEDELGILGEERAEAAGLGKSDEGPALDDPFAGAGADNGRSTDATEAMLLCKSPGTSFESMFVK